jgi:hypothetical protein
MPIPDFIDNVLPEGVYDCTLDEVKQRFGQFRRSDRRLTLTEKLEQYCQEARNSGIISSIIIDGSYVMNKDEPDDVDIIAVIGKDVDLSVELKPYQSNAIDRDSIKRRYRFDGRSYKDGEPGLAKMVSEWMVVPEKHKELTSQARKGMVRITL